MKKGRIFGYIMLVVAVILLVVVILNEIGAVRETGDTYSILRNYEISAEESVVIGYDDGLAAVLFYGTNDTLLTMEQFLKDSLRNIDIRIMAATLLYAAVISTMLLCFLYDCCGENRKKHVLSVVIVSAAVYLIILAAVYAAMASVGLPAYMPTGKYLIILIIGLMSLIAGNCAFAAWLRAGKAKVIISIAAILLLGVTYLFGSVFEGGLYNEPTELSFDYLAEIEEGIFDEDYSGNAYYNEENNTIVLNGKEYPQMESPNPEHYTGAKRACAIAFEVLNPYSAFSLPLIAHGAELNVPVIALVLYFIKALLWIILPGRRKKAEA